MKKRFFTSIAFVVALVIIAETAYTHIHSTQKTSSSGGINGYSGYTGSTCGSCHFNNTGTTTTITSNTSISVGDTYYEYLTVSDNGRRYGGMNVAVDPTKALLIPVSSDITANGAGNELYHNAKFDKGTTSGDYTYTFKVVPISPTPGSFTLYYAGLGANGSGTSGDAWQASSKTFTTTGAMPSGSVTIPSDNAINSSFFRPINLGSAYSRQSAIYTQSEIGTYGYITKISYFVTKESSVGGNVKIYMNSTNNSSFSSNATVNSTLSGATLVYDGYAYMSQAGWNTLLLNTPFLYTSGNLQITFLNQRGGNGVTDAKECANQQINNATLYWDNNQDNTQQSSIGSNRANIQLQFLGNPTNLTSSNITQNSIDLSWSAATGATDYQIVYKRGSSAPTSTSDGNAITVSSSVTNYTLSGLAMNMNYSVAVYALNSITACQTAPTLSNISTLNKTDLGFSNAQTASMVIGQSDFEGGSNPNRGGSASANSLNYNGGLFVTDNNGSDGKLFIADAGNHRIMIYNTVPNTIDQSANIIIGQTSASATTSGCSATKLDNPSDVEVATIGGTTYLVIADKGNNRVIIHNSVPSTSGTYVEQTASKVLGQPNFTTKTSGCTAAKMSTPLNIKISGTKLLVADADNNRVLIWNNFTTAASGSSADVVIGQPNFTGPMTPPTTNNSSAQTLIYPWGIDVSSTGKLFIASRLEHRVLVYNSIPTSNYASADYVLGQTNFSNNSAPSSTTASSMGFIRDIAISKTTSYERIAIGEYGNGRIMIWNTIPTTNNQAADVVLGQSGLTTNTGTGYSILLSSANAGNLDYMFWSPSGNLYKSDYSRILRYDGGNGIFSGPTSINVTNITSNSATINWSGGNATNIRITVGNGYNIDNITGNSYNLNGLDCNMPYTITLFGKKDNTTYISGVDGAYTPTNTNINTLAGSSCEYRLPKANNTVYATAIYNNILYLAGNFNNIGGVTRNGLAAINATTGDVLSFNPNVTVGGNPGVINTIRISNDGAYLFIAGSFDNIGGSSYNSLAKISTATGLPVSNFPQVNTTATIRQMNINANNWIAFYGDFTTLGNETGMSGVGAVDGNGNVISTFKPVCGNLNQLRSVAISDNNQYVYLGHANAEVEYNNDANQHVKSFGEFKLSDGQKTSFFPFTNNKSTLDILMDGPNTLFIGGSFDDITLGNTTTDRKRILKLTGGPGNWVLDPSFAPTNTTNSPYGKANNGTTLASVRCLWLDGNKLFIAGDMEHFGPAPRYSVGAIDKNDGTLINEIDLGINDFSCANDCKMTGSAQSKFITWGFLPSTASHAFGKRYTGYNYVLANYGTHPSVKNAGATVDVFVNGDMVYDFGGTGVDMNVTGNTSAARVTCERLTDMAPNISGVSETYKSNYRFIVSNISTSGFDQTSLEMRFNLNEIPFNGVGNANTVKIYKRNNIGYGPFTDCGTVTVTGSELRVTINESALNTVLVGEFIFASNDDANPLGVVTAKTNGNWNDATTWNPEMVPGSNNHVSIPGNYTVTLTANTTTGNLFISNNASLDLNQKTLTINGSIIGNGNITGCPTCNLVASGSNDLGVLKMNQSNQNTNSLGNLTLNRNGIGAMTLGNNLNLHNTLTLTSGTLFTNNSLTIVSNASYTGRVASINYNNAISGNVTIQRFIPGGSNKRRWRFLASPVSGVTFSNSWQQDIHITGNGTGGTMCANANSTNATKHTNGFDATINNTASVRKYNETSGNWESINTTITDELVPGVGYLTFIRGDRNTQGCALLATNNPTSDDVTLKATGVLHTGPKTINLTNHTGTGDGWNLVGNPYQSAIDWNHTTWANNRNSNINLSIWVWNPLINNYASWHPVAGSANNGSNMIGPGQSFFIKVDANTDITFDESYKLTNQSIGMFGKTAIANRLSVVLSDSLSSDEAIVYFDKGATKNIDTKYDAEKLGYTVGSIASFTLYDSTKLVFNGSKLFASNTSFDTIALQTYLGSSPKTYTLTLNGVNTFNNTQIFLADKFTQSRVNISNYNKYHFSVTSNPLSYTQTRFYLVFANTLQNLPVSLLELNAKLSSQHRVDLNWSTASELNNKGFDIEHSTNGIDYYAIGFVKGAGNAAYKNSYQYIHLQPSKGINYYRLKQIDFDNSFSYSDIVYVQTEDNITEEHVQIFPVPAKTHLTISSSHPFEEVNILDINGKTITHSKGNSLEVSQLPAGIYITEIIYTSGNITRHKFIKE